MTDSSVPLQAVAFDMDGLMFNTEALYQEVGAELLRRRGRQVTRELLSEMMGRPSPVALQIMIDWHQLDATVGQLEQETDEIFDTLLPMRQEPLPGLQELLAALAAANIPRAVTTSSRRRFLDQALRISGLQDYFSFFLCAEDIVEGKPAPEIYEKAAARFGVSAAEMMVLEDSENGCRAAVAARAWTVAVPGDHSRDHDFSGAALIANDLNDPRIYARLNLRSA